MITDSNTEVAEAVGFEPTDGCPSLVFKTSALNHSATLPSLPSEGRGDPSPGQFPTGPV